MMVVSNFQCRGVLLILIIVHIGQGFAVLTTCAGGFTLFFIANHNSVLSFSLKYCLKGLFNPKKTTSQTIR